MTTRKRLEKTGWVPVPDLGFDMQIRFLPRKDLQKMLARATETTWDRQAGANVDKVNPEKLIREYAGVILAWREDGEPGLKRETYARMVNIDPSEYPEIIPCTDEYKVELLEEAYGLDVVVRQICTDLACFQDRQQEAEIKNS